MYCPNCGSEEAGTYCEKCGALVASPANGTAVLNIVRKSSFWGVAANILVTVDGVSKTLGNNETLTYNLSLGEHTIIYKVWCRKQKEVKINIVDPTKVYSLVFKVDFWLGGFKIDEKESVLQ